MQPGPVAAVYPVDRASTIVLRDGSTLSVRPIRAEDEAGLAHFFCALSMESRILRFFAPVANADASAKRMVHVDYKSQYGLVAMAGLPEQIVAHAMYIEIGPRKAELAVAVADSYQGRGLGTILLGQLAEIATASGIDMFEAIVMPDNRTMLSMLRESGFPVHARSEPGEVHAELPTALDRYRGAQKADVGSLEDVLLRVSALVEDHPEIAEMDLNPLVVHEAGSVVVDARIRVVPAASRPALGTH